MNLCSQGARVTGQHVADPLTDDDGVVGDPLYVAAGRMRVEHEAGCAVPVLSEKVHDELAIAAVENVVSALQARSGRKILVEPGRRALHDPAVLSALAVDDQERVDRP